MSSKGKTTNSKASARTTSSTTRQRSSRKSGARKSSEATESTSSQTQGEHLPAPSTDPSLTHTFTELEPLPYKPPTRDSQGRFVAGTSGNPSGRPPNRKNQLTEIKQELELAVRQNISPEQIAQVVHRLYELALMGSVGAAKLLLDKTISNARTEEDDNKDTGGVTIRIENMTLDNTAKGEVIDVTPNKPEEQ